MEWITFFRESGGGLRTFGLRQHLGRFLCPVRCTFGAGSTLQLLAPFLMSIGISMGIQTHVSLGGLFITFILSCPWTLSMWHLVGSRLSRFHWFDHLFLPSPAHWPGLNIYRQLRGAHIRVPWPALEDNRSDRPWQFNWSTHTHTHSDNVNHAFGDTCGPIYHTSSSTYPYCDVKHSINGIPRRNRRMHVQSFDQDKLTTVYSHKQEHVKRRWIVANGHVTKVWQTLRHRLQKQVIKTRQRGWKRERKKEKADGG
jgi:hypothetical protein